MKQGDGKPATEKLAKFSEALEEFRKRMWGKAAASEAALPPAPPPSAAAPVTAQVDLGLPVKQAPAQPSAGPAEANPPGEAAAQLESNAPPDADSPTRVVAPSFYQQRGEIAERLKRELAAAAPAVEGRATQASPDVSRSVRAAVERGASIWSKTPDPSMDGYIVGLDIGTSSVKCAYRQPYMAGDPVRCLTVPLELRSMGHPYLWQTAVWFEPKAQTFALTPSDGAIALEGFKSGLIRDQGQSPASHDCEVSKAEAMTAFMALKVAHLIGAYDIAKPLGPNGAELYLSINMGIPVAAHDDKATRSIYEKMVAAARQLIPSAGKLTLSDVRSQFAQASVGPAVGISLIPELVAAMSGYAADPTAPHGAHVLVDVGASTLDVVAFNLMPKKHISVFTARVETLGAAALDYARAVKISDREFKAACDHEFEQVYGGARKRAPSLFHPGIRKNPVQLVKTGGGCATPLHEQFIAEMNKEGVLGALPDFHPQPPPDMASETCDTSRLLLAYGLTRDLPELLSLRLPSQIDDLPPPLPTLPEMIGKEQI